MMVKNVGVVSLRESLCIQFSKNKTDKKSFVGVEPTTYYLQR